MHRWHRAKLRTDCDLHSDTWRRANLRAVCDLLSNTWPRANLCTVLHVAIGFRRSQQTGYHYMAGFEQHTTAIAKEHDNWLLLPAACLLTTGNSSGAGTDNGSVVLSTLSHFMAYGALL